MTDRGTAACWACWHDLEAEQCTAFAPVGPLPALVSELARNEEVRPVLCAHCLLAGVNLQRTQRCAGPERGGP